MIVSLLNRLALACAAAGLAISTVLTIAHAKKVPLPCGGGSGCERVAEDASSMFLGVPVSAFGIAAYVLLIAFALMRIKGVAVRACSIAGLIVAVTGTAVSASLTYYSITHIHATCMWCIGSALMMTLSAFCYLATPQILKGVPEAGKPSTAIPWGILPILAIFGYAKYGPAAKEPPVYLSTVKLNQVSLAVLEGSSYSLGSKDAPVTIAEFADLMCPACREMHQRLLRFVAHNNGKARLLYHCFPLSKLEGHENSQYAATLSEELNPKDFWEFVSQVYGLKEKPSRSDLDKIQAPFHDRIRDKKAAADELARSIKIGEDYGVKLTPTYILFIDGKPSSVASSNNINAVLHEPKYVRIFVPRRK